MSSRTFALAAVSAISLLGAVSCSSSSSAPSNQGLVAGSSGDTGGTEVNPYGVAYPTTGIGFKPRSDPSSNTPGDKIKNFKFLGYLNSDKGGGLTTISLADFFDPETKNYKLLHISVAGVWCYWCKEETKALVPLIPQLQQKKVIYITALSENNSHGPAVQSDLDYWINTWHTNYTQVLDPGNRDLGPFFTSAGIPWNGNFDARTMEILSSVTSAPAGADGQIDILGDVQPWLDWIDQHPIAK
jgi:hypothetical protein